MKIIFASGNAHKVLEVAAVLGSEIELSSLRDLGFTGEIPETGHTFEANAAIKAQFVSKLFTTDCIADDSGLEVEYLDHAPGVYSARYAGEKATDQENVQLLLKNMFGVLERTARFVTVICLVKAGQEYFFRGELKGRIIETPRGNNGFGYDPIFVPEGFDQTLAELTAKQKNSISHRALAIKKLVDFLKEGI